MGTPVVQLTVVFEIYIVSMSIYTAVLGQIEAFGTKARRTTRIELSMLMCNYN